MCNVGRSCKHSAAVILSPPTEVTMATSSWLPGATYR